MEVLSAVVSRDGHLVGGSLLTLTDSFWFAHVMGNITIHSLSHILRLLEFATMSGASDKATMFLWVP